MLTFGTLAILTFRTLGGWQTLKDSRYTFKLDFGLPQEPGLIVWHPQRPRTPQALANLPPQDLAVIFEWAVAQELWRKMCIHDSEGLPDYLNFWQSKTHEIDFVDLHLNTSPRFIEVKKGSESPINFMWFLKTHPHQHLDIINANRFDTQNITGITLEDFLLDEPSN